MIDNNKILVELESKLKSVTDIESFTKVKVEYVGKKGLITNLMQEMRNVEDKKSYGQMVNVLKEAIEEKVKNQNVLREQDIDKIINTYQNREVIEKYSNVASLEEVKANDYNLNITRYVNTFEEAIEININDLNNILIQ